jgi:hypothetical protein
VASHPHEDHIGSLLTVLNDLEATKIIREKWLIGSRIIVVTAFDDCRDNCIDAGAALDLGESETQITCAENISFWICIFNE